MARLIDLEALGIGKCNPDVFNDKGYAKGWNSAIEILQNAPTVDAVPVVRCCECKKCATDECCFFARGEWGMSGPDWNFYCADGERKGGNE